MDGRLGETRSVVRREYCLHTPDTWVRTPLSEVIRGVVVVHCSPAMGAGFLLYRAELDALGELTPLPTASGLERFVWVLQGAVDVELGGDARRLEVGDYCLLPPGFPGGVATTHAAVLVVIEKRYEPLPGVPAPAAFFGREQDVTAVPLAGDEELLVRALVPAGFAFDLAVNTMTYAAGAALGQVEVHVMEHGLVMLEGEGTYRLGEEGYGVEAGDFIWMGPYCPQWFVAEGDSPARYLIYKDWNRRPRL